MGDAVMAFWGAPDDQPDHAERACRAALEIMRAVVADNRARKARGLAPVRLRIGVHSGAAIVGNIGAPGRVNYTLIDATVNVAHRPAASGPEAAAGGEGDGVSTVGGRGGKGGVSQGRGGEGVVAEQKKNRTRE